MTSVTQCSLVFHVACTSGQETVFRTAVLQRGAVGARRAAIFITDLCCFVLWGCVLSQNRCLVKSTCYVAYVMHSNGLVYCLTTSSTVTAATVSITAYTLLTNHFYTFVFLLCLTDLIRPFLSSFKEENFCDFQSRAHIV
jgi:hypothetical protein